ncbi:hypothetical protein B0T14DRAFT_87942 [Immersiella caudata]|uniref:Uncharacterized protein n=1 Tax=Immersiella caudata TaxID=314043 RepID=A0AA39X214_9PEZI|nr:hypothetical protein B0T14DRAFT_87942 [Immersiella caudata]
MQRRKQGCRHAFFSTTGTAQETGSLTRIRTKVQKYLDSGSKGKQTKSLFKVLEAFERSSLSPLCPAPQLSSYSSLLHRGERKSRQNSEWTAILKTMTWENGDSGVGTPQIVCSMSILMWKGGATPGPYADDGLASALGRHRSVTPMTMDPRAMLGPTTPLPQAWTPMLVLPLRPPDGTSFEHTPDIPATTLGDAQEEAAMHNGDWVTPH